MMGIGGSGGGGGTDAEDEEEEDEGVPPEQTTVDDIPDDEPSDDSDGDTAAAAGAAAGAVGAGGGATSGGGGAAAGGGGATGGTGGPSSNGSNEGGEDSEESEESESESESESDSDADSGDKEEAEGESPQDTEVEREQEADETTDADQTHNEEGEEGEPEEEEDEQEPQEAELTVVTDAWDATGWGIEPVLKRLDQDFGISFDLSYELLSPRELDGDDWDEASARYDMPYAQPVELPNDTRNSTSALRVAQELDRDRFRDYLRRLRIAALVEGQDIENRGVLIELAEDVGFDVEEFDETWRGNLDEISQYAKTPLMWATVGDREIPWQGNLEYGLAFGVLLDNDVPPLGGASSYERLVSEYAPITTTEIAAITGENETQVEAELGERESARKVEHGDGVFWEKL